ncbi:hypothetical protein [Halorientalis salina]|uniref:hypothetical protein n=1 Tax=Halorientalis salina TaxID=2932266 RepID=UPI0010AD2D31|nr:hypothetical protein [Halorientalis salina]
MNVIGDLVARERRRKEPLVYSSASQPYTAHKFCTDAWKAASLFRYHGLGPGRRVAIADDATPQALLGFFAGALLGAEVRFGDPTDGDARLVLGPADPLVDWEPAPGTKRVVYGDQPDDPDVIHFERDVWSENPTMPPDRVDPDTDVLVTDDETYTHDQLLSATERVIADQDLTADDEVAVESSLARPGTLVAGVLAPLSVQATILLPGTDRTGTMTVTDDEVSDTRTVSADAIL